MTRPHLAVTLGDPRGIGPEVSLRAIESIAAGESSIAVSVVVPDATVPADDAARVIREYVSSGQASDSVAGAAAARSIERAVTAALAGTFHAVVTGPSHKPSLHAAGWDVPGQTEMLARLTGSSPVGMLMAAARTKLGSPLRILLATTHLALRDVPEAVSEDLLFEQTSLLDGALRRDWALAEPRLGLCALNPHASDGGLFGTEEAQTFAPAVERLRSAGIRVNGPVPADTVFSRALAGEFDAVVAPYHDVGMAAFKTVAFGSGVNVTIGLPFVRTSPDHGTAFDIAGSGRADPSSMLEALQLAARLAHARFDTSTSRV